MSIRILDWISGRISSLDNIAEHIRTGRRNVLCFVEVKTRTTRDVKPAEAAVDREKRRELLAVAREYLRRLPHSRFELFRNISA